MSAANASRPQSETLLGYVIGAGVERIVAENVFVGVDYRFTDFGAMTLDGANSFIDDGALLMAHGAKQWGHLSENAYRAEIDPHMHALRVTMGYRF